MARMSLPRDHYLLRARIARTAGERETDPELKVALDRLAIAYDRVAKLLPGDDKEQEQD